jgi:GNAT superfamily N-acetyltransferase
MVVGRRVGDGAGMHTVMEQLEIRPLEPADRDRLAEGFALLGEETRRRRFGGVAKRLGRRDLDRLSRIDHHCHEAVAAVEPSSGRIAGVARYIALRGDPGRAEVAIAVADEWQGRGVGRRLMASLTERARAEGITRLVAYVDADNRRVLEWIARAGAADRAGGGETGVEIRLGRA